MTGRHPWNELKKSIKSKRCVNCVMFVSDTSQCTIVSPPDVRPGGVCDRWYGGTPVTSDDAEIKEIVSKEKVNYTDNAAEHRLNS